MTRAVEGKRNRRRNPGNGPPETGSDAIQQVTMSRADETGAAPIVETPITGNPTAEETTTSASAIESLEIQRLNQRAGG